MLQIVVPIKIATIYICDRRSAAMHVAKLNMCTMSSFTTSVGSRRTSSAAAAAGVVSAHAVHWAISSRFGAPHFGIVVCWAGQVTELGIFDLNLLTSQATFGLWIVYFQ